MRYDTNDCWELLAIIQIHRLAWFEVSLGMCQVPISLVDSVTSDSHFEIPLTNLNVPVSLLICPLVSYNSIVVVGGRHEINLSIFVVFALHIRVAVLSVLLSSFYCYYRLVICRNSY